MAVPFADAGEPRFPGKAQRESVAPPTRDRSNLFPALSRHRSARLLRSPLSRGQAVPVLQRTIPRFALHAALRRDTTTLAHAGWRLLWLHLCD